MLVRNMEITWYLTKNIKQLSFNKKPNDFFKFIFNIKIFLSVIIKFYNKLVICIINITWQRKTILHNQQIVTMFLLSQGNTWLF